MGMKEIIVAYDENTERSPAMGKWVGELVRCKDCKHHGEWSCAVCIDEIFETAGNWFCADGEKRDD